MPLRGSYLYPRLDILPKGLQEMRALLYPIPPLNSNLFLGTHTTITHDGKLKFGPTATPVLWRENYKDDFSSFNFSEFTQIVKEGAKCLLSPQFKLFAKLLKQQLYENTDVKVVNDAKNLISTLDNFKVDENIA